jgi:regulator of Ty1 transposition protein 103
LQDLENSASSDAVVREKIARLPPEVSETSHLEKINSTDEGLELMAQVIFTLTYRIATELWGVVST